MTAQDRARKLVTLTGVFPLAVFLVEHLVMNASALGGAARFDAVVGTIARSPWTPWAEVALVLVPLAIHTLYGLHLVAARRPPVREYPLFGARMVFLQRLTSVVLLVFLVGHLFELRIHRFRTALPAAAIHARLAEHLSSTTSGVPWVALAYVIGVAAATFHLANGLWAYSVSRRGLETAAEKKRAAIVPFALGGALFVIATTTIVTFANGGALLPEPDALPATCGSAAPSATAGTPAP